MATAPAASSLPLAEGGGGGEGGEPPVVEGEEEPAPEPEDCDSAFVAELGEAHALALGEFSTALAQAVSKRERDERGHMGGHFAYGEFSFRAMASTLSRVAAIAAAAPLPAGGADVDGVEAGVLHYRAALADQAGWESTEARLARCAEEGLRGEFADVGSGVGFACVAAALLGGFARCRGVEVLEGLGALAVEVARRWEGMGPLVRSETALELRAGSVLDEDGGGALGLSAASVVLWCNGTWDDEEATLPAATVTAKLEDELREGACVITCSAELQSPCFDKCDEARHAMHWGECTVFIYRRNGAPAGQEAPWTGADDTGGGGGGDAGAEAPAPDA